MQDQPTFEHQQKAQKEFATRVARAQLATQRLEASVCAAPVRAVKCRVQPTKEQHAKLLLWAKAVRWTYNKMAEHCNAHFVTNGCFPPMRTLLARLRALFVNSDALAGDLAWLLETPMDVRDHATLDLETGIKAHNTRVAQWRVKRDELTMKGVELPAMPTCHFKFRSRRDNQVLDIRSRDWNRKSGAYADVFGPKKLLCKRMALPQVMAADFKVVYDRRARWFICMPQHASMAEGPPPTPGLNCTVSLDPGVR
jgi:hypothetical protein